MVRALSELDKFLRLRCLSEHRAATKMASETVPRLQRGGFSPQEPHRYAREKKPGAGIHDSRICVEVVLLFKVHYIWTRIKPLSLVGGKKLWQCPLTLFVGITRAGKNRSTAQGCENALF